MNVILWIVQGVLAAMFLVAGMMKVSQPRQKLIDTMGWPADFQTTPSRESVPLRSSEPSGSSCQL
jgi:hypothetical protein